MNSTSLEETQSPVSGFCLLSKSSMQRGIFIIKNHQIILIIQLLVRIFLLDAVRIWKRPK